jgi:hypothetical protein
MDMWLGGGEGVSQYIPRLHVTEKYVPIYSSGRCNRGIYFYIPLYHLSVNQGI